MGKIIIPDSPLIHSSEEIERRFLGKHGKLILTGESISMTQMQLGTGEAKTVLGEFLALLQLPYYSRVLRYHNDKICELLDELKPENNVKMRVRKYGNKYGKITVKIRHGIQNKYKVYTEKDILIPVRIANLLLTDIGHGITPVRKRRYQIIGTDGRKWDIDLYEDENSGLLTAEIEANSTLEKFKKLNGVGKEVTTGPWKPLVSTEGLQYRPISEWNPVLRNRLMALLVQ